MPEGSQAKHYRVVVAWVAGAIVVLLAAWLAIVAGLHLAVPRLQSWLRDRAASALQQEFGRPVRIQGLEASASGAKVRFVITGVEIGDLARVQRANAQAELFPLRIRSLVLEGLSIHLSGNGPAVGSRLPATTTIGDIVADHACVDVLQLHFEFSQLHIRNFNSRRPAQFSASVELAEPKALIKENGSIGPWDMADPSQTPVDAAYSIQGSDLGSVPGLAGTLSSQGRIRGTLRRAAVTGDADIAGFGLKVSGRTQPLKAHIEAVIDDADSSASISTLTGTLRGSSFAASGTVHNIEDDPRREIAFDVRVPKGRLEDILPLGVRSKVSPVSGALQAEAKVNILPGEKNILDRMRVTARFRAAQARFASFDLRERLRDLSRKAQGRPKDMSAGSSISNMEGQVEIARGVARFSKLDFELEGASAQLAGTYELASEQMDLSGMVSMEAKLSQTTTGAKAVLLKMAEPFMKNKHGGAQVAIRVTGTREDPQFGLSLAKKMPQTR
ncbi:MAG TPA: AsmA-like C-terminal region-containing protein [Bryobacteraceae bacterium]|nr:AsmA-like C-terminal region-containing protein [Bryobacteraceae bacterium]